MTDGGRGTLAEETVASVVRPEIRALSAYAVARLDADDNASAWVKLDAMENPYPLPDAVKARLSAALARVAINRYPDASGEGARRALRRALEIPEEAGLLLGNGSDELIQIVVSALAKPGAVVLAPEPSFVMYRMDALYASTRFVGVPLNPDFSLDRDAMLAAIERESPALIFLAYPNNPTGNLFADADIGAIIEASPGLVVVDEAYYAFADASFLSRVPELPNLLVLRTLSKVGMAGIRLGYAVAAPAWIAELNKVRQPVRVYPTQTNFVLVRVNDANRVFDGLKARRILIKNLHGWHPLLTNCLRMTVGTPAENDLLLSALAELEPSSGSASGSTRGPTQ